ncbi:ABC transporter permease [Nocardioides sp. ChNu-153]|uniref:ABC transporter permease n=1 Tax=Nocardioides sp. ChNu-153 TaxID=2779364 RepID=UPI00264A8B96|nr:ABC transporter permease [Nocardioides sp. ChNu-153]MDN7123128.1 ABC transporter permease [Nocardioides sp. ChNu-153]
MSSTTPLASLDLTPAPADAPRVGPLRRLVGLARANALLLTRNRMTLSYALLLPLLPLTFLLAGDRGDTTAGTTAMSSVLMLGALFPVFYNLLSLVVTRRDELVLKRLRTGEARDGEILLSMALPGVVAFVLISAVATVALLALGQPAPANPVVAIAAVLLGAAAFAGLAFWTAAWTRNAEAAQLTSMPVILIAVVGNLRAVFPERLQPFVDLTPGAALDALARAGWFGQDVEGAELSFAETFTTAAEPLLVLAAWTALAVWLTLRTMRWEPRA